ncbi:hypothetical protein FBU59_004365 [Linderina macrospora]|uniref:Uncharacterized protein n=1 Tax=Linderina macrospora TaxID=4868 RepID=A0ACC1J5X9_9FUNG|nr:hypothetical protein FBU59_004365 [Linderina macrospora]
MAMEFARYKYQPMAQVVGAMVGLVGFVFGWIGGSIDNVYARFGWFMLSLLLVQTALNLMLSTRLIQKNRSLESLYRYVTAFQFVFTYMAMVLGVITFLGLCSHGHLGQCISHFARGSVLMGAAMASVIAMRLCGPVIVELGRPLEFFECGIIATVGLIGTFTEHNFFQSSGTDAWSHKDLQHTMIGICWLAGGLLGMTMTWRSLPRNRSPIPALIFIATGVSMIIHQQDLVMASQTHFLFGSAMVITGVVTIFEITIIASGFIKERGEPSLFQFVPLYFMCASGMFLMGSNRDMVLLLINSKVDIATYGLLLLSFCFVIFFYFYLLTDLYLKLRQPPSAKYEPVPTGAESDDIPKYYS